jgi:cytochrome c556
MPSPACKKEITMRKYLLFSLVVVLLPFGCSKPRLASESETVSADTSTPQPQYRPTSSIKDIMDSMVDPSAGYIWDAVATVITEKGVDERFPKTPDDWAEIRRKAITLVEATNLLIMPGRKAAQPGEKSDYPGIELSPEEIDAALQKDRNKFIGHAMTLNDRAMDILKAIDAKDKDAVLDRGAALDAACESCHKIYWYPNEGKNLNTPAPSIRDVDKSKGDNYK